MLVTSNYVFIYASHGFALIESGYTVSDFSFTKTQQIKNSILMPDIIFDPFSNWYYVNMTSLSTMYQ